ncbi:SHOCT domain-containing protein [Tepidicaulis sp. LMO-SS28]|jgi:putative membrane protein|uniref:SHOCT domain-containing protein n=1 Tax=Tepidicaulis sp. LMO-SS28 TaxID=3447455 RepID=UPI000A64A6DD|tara:strand:- start:175 stop:510 length:336 start_codon:yes stop_codon:yes gene_type:complete
MRRQLTNLALALPTAVVSMPALAQTPADRSDYWHYGWGWGHMIFGSVMMIVFWGGIILAIILAARWLGGDSGRVARSQSRTNGPLDILHERFARGEIDKEEFEERKRLLSD